MMKIGDRVQSDIDGSTGTVIGHAIVESYLGDEMETNLVVRLDHGFYNPGKSIYVSCMVWHEENAREIL